MTAPISDLIFLARCAEKADRYADAAEYMKTVVQRGHLLAPEERSLFQISYKNKLNTYRETMRLLKSIQDNIEDEWKKELTMKFREELKQELKKICDEALGLIDEYLYPKAPDAIAKVFFLKTKADYYRYLAETMENDDRSQMIEKARQCYQSAEDVAKKDVDEVDPVRVGLALNFSVFYYDFGNDKDKAIQTAKDAIDIGVRFFENLSNDERQKHLESLTLLSLLRDNLSLWSPEDSMIETDTESRPGSSDSDEESF